MQTPWNPLSWASDHWTQLTIAGAITGFLYRIHRLATKGKKYLQNLDGAQASIDTIKTNHLPHLQMELEKINNNLQGLREDTRGFRDDLRMLLVKQ